MIYKATSLIAKAFDKKGIKYGNKIEETGSSSYVEAGFSVEGGPLALVKFISNDNNNDVSVRLYRLIRGVNSNKLAPLLIAVNQLNNKFCFVKFTLGKR